MPMKIFWAMDPFTEDLEFRKASVAVLRWMSRPSDKTTAVYVYSPPAVGFPSIEGFPMGVGFPAVSKRTALDQMKKLKVSGMRTEVIESANASLTDSVRVLSTHVHKQRGDLILSSTHARSGMPRFVLGSFAETLIHFAKTDLLLFQPTVRLSGAKPSRLLYAHDFSRVGEIGLRRAIDYASRFGARLDVFHIPHTSYGVRFEGQDPKVDTYRKSVQAKVRRVEKILREAGLEGSVLIGSEWAPMISMILKTATKQKSDLLVTTAQTGRFAALLGGSVTRNLIRRSKIPTLVLKI